MKKPRLISASILIDTSIGACIGFFILHPLSMVIHYEGEIFHFTSKHFLLTLMSLYFACIGLVFGTVSGFFRLKLKQKNLELKRKQLYIEEKNRNYEDSINYARHIQLATLVRADVVKKALPESFILFKPKDIISGDFYWFTEIDDKIFIAAIDCIGHGVPGALLSMIANDLLVEIVKVLKITVPDKILNTLDMYFKETLKQEETKNQDGLDIALCVVNKKQMILEYAGANNPLVYFL